MEKTKMESGPHIGAVRRWIQWNFRNGSQVTWGSDDLLDGRVSVRDLERLAQQILEAVDEKRHEREAEIKRLRSELLRAQMGLDDEVVRRTRRFVQGGEG